MKKFILVASLAAFFASCSTDDVLVQEDNSAAFETADTYTSKSYETFRDCFNITASTDIDVSQGWGNPIVYFYGTTSFIKSGLDYYVSVEVQQLEDCEDVQGAGFGSTFFVNNTIISNPNTETIRVTVPATSLPANCWRYRVIMKGCRSGSTTISCASVSEWYESPLF